MTVPERDELEWSQNRRQKLSAALHVTGRGTWSEKGLFHAQCAALRPKVGTQDHGELF